DTLRVMVSRLSRLVALTALLTCLVCPLVEALDVWDPDQTMQTGGDTEYALVVVALCVGVGFSLLQLLRHSMTIQSVAGRSPLPKKETFFLGSSLFAEPSIAASPPGLPLRI